MIDLQKRQGKFKTQVTKHVGQEAVFDMFRESPEYKEMKEALSNLDKKTDVYLKLYPDDKELRSYKDQAHEVLRAIEGKP